VLVDPLVALADEAADDGRRRVDGGRLVLLDDLPVAVRFGVGGQALEEDAGHAHAERAVDDVAVAGDPPDVGRAEVDIVVVQVEDVLARVVHVEQVAPGAVDDALRRARGAGRVENEERMLGVDRDRRAVGGDVGGRHLIVVPDVAAFLHVHVAVDTLDDDDRLDRGPAADRDVGVGLGGRGLGAAVSFVGADEHLGAAVVDARLEGLGGEASEDHHVDGADAGAGEHDHRQLGDHRHVQRDAVTLLDAVLLEHVGELTDLVEELLEGAGLRVSRVALEDQGRLVTLAGFDVTVQAVVRGVEFAALEPLDVRDRLEAPVEDLVPLLRPHQRVFGALGPVALRILDGALVLSLILLEALDIGALRVLG